MRPVSHPYLSAMSIAPTTFPRDLDIATPPFWTIPWVNRRVMGSPCETKFRSRITLQKNREYNRCKMA